MNKFRSILEFISSRLLFLVLGIFLAVGATYVYATWDQAIVVGDPGQLSKDNWNQLVTMIETSISSRIDNAYSASFTILPHDTNMMGNASMTCSSTTCPAGWTSITTYNYDIDDYCDSSYYICGDTTFRKRCTATVCGLAR